MEAESLTTRATNVWSPATWWKSPQRVWLRRAIFQIHLWAGIALALYAVVIGLSGSALVFAPEIEDLLEGGRFHVAPSPRQFTLDQAIRAIKADRPGWRGVGLEDFEKPDRATTLLLLPDSAASANYRIVSFNPYTGRVLLDRMRFSGVMGWITNLHFYLLAGHTGLLVSGWMAACLLLLCISGLVLWWPGARRWTAGLFFHRRSRWQRVNWDLHIVVGFWCSAALAILCLTGLYFAFPTATEKVIFLLTGGGQPTNSKPSVAASTSGAALTIDEVLACAKKALPANAPAGYLQLPSKQTAPYSVTGYYTGAAPYSQLVQIALDPHTGAVLSHTDTRAQPLGARIIQYSFTVHFGSFGGDGVLGVAVKLLWIVLGIAPALLAATGLLMYWNRKLLPLWKSFATRR